MQGRHAEFAEVGLSGGGGAARAADVFRRHDTDNSGQLDKVRCCGALPGGAGSQAGAWAGCCCCLAAAVWQGRAVLPRLRLLAIPGVIRGGVPCAVSAGRNDGCAG